MKNSSFYMRVAFADPACLEKTNCLLNHRTQAVLHVYRSARGSAVHVAIGYGSNGCALKKDLPAAFVGRIPLPSNTLTADQVWSGLHIADTVAVPCDDTTII